MSTVPGAYRFSNQTRSQKQPTNKVSIGPSLHEYKTESRTSLPQIEREDRGCTADTRLAVEGVSLVTIQVELVEDLLNFRGSLNGRSFAGQYG